MKTFLFGLAFAEHDEGYCRPAECTPGCTDCPDYCHSDNLIDCAADFCPDTCKIMPHAHLQNHFPTYCPDCTSHESCPIGCHYPSFPACSIEAPCEHQPLPCIGDACKPKTFCGFDAQCLPNHPSYPHCHKDFPHCAPVEVDFCFPDHPEYPCNAAPYCTPACDHFEACPPDCVHHEFPAPYCKFGCSGSSCLSGCIPHPQICPQHCKVKFIPYPVIKKVDVGIPIPVVKPTPVPYPVYKKVGIPIPYPKPVKVIQPIVKERKVGIPVPVKFPVPVPYPVVKPHKVYQTITQTKRYPVPYPVAKPFPVPKAVPVPYPVVKKYPVPFPVAKPYPVPKAVPVPYPVTKKYGIPVPVAKPVPVPYTVTKKVGVPVPYPKPVPYSVAAPYPVAVPYPKPYPVAKPVPVPYTVTRKVGVPVPYPKAAPYPVEKKVPYPVAVPYCPQVCHGLDCPHGCQPEVHYCSACAPSIQADCTPQPCWPHCEEQCEAEQAEESAEVFV